MAKRERILECAFNEFTRSGIKRSSVDCIAAKMHISKKTIYEFFENKENLLLCSVQHEIGKILEGIKASSESCTDVLSIIIAHSVRLFKFCNATGRGFYSELVSYPETMAYIQNVRALLLESGKRRFAQGIEEGYLREDTDINIVGRLLESQIVAFETGDNSHTPDEICKLSLMIILRGVCTDKGVEYLDNLERKY